MTTAKTSIASPPVVEWGAARRALPGQSACGDGFCVCAIPGGVVLAAIDGLGHGEEAAAAASMAVATIEAHAHESVIAILRACHVALRETRGAVLSLAAFAVTDDTLTWTGVGNVEGVLFRADPAARPVREHMFCHAGTVGFLLSAMRATVIPVVRGDTLVLTTDGIRSEFADRMLMAVTDAPQRLADHALTTCAKDNDDALVLVARYKGGPR